MAGWNRYIPGSRARHPALTNREELLRVLDRYDWQPTLAAKSMGISRVTVVRRLKELAPDVVAAKQAQGLLLGRDGKAL